MLFDVYSKFDLTPERASGCYLWDTAGNKYLDLYGGHGVISIGHNHPHWVESLERQLHSISFYSNAVHMPLQEEVAEKIAIQSGYHGYALFMANSGAEANENALKLASFHTKRKKVVSFSGGFHGRTSGTMAVSDYPKNRAPYNNDHEVIFYKLGDEAVFDCLKHEDIAAVIIEGIQGIAGVVEAESSFLQQLRNTCTETGTVLILDEVQSGFGRSGKFFAHQHAEIQADIVTMAKGMGNGFPVGGLLISPEIEPWKGMLGTTFGGSYLACAATLATLQVLENEKLIEHAAEQEGIWKTKLSEVSGFLDVYGRGLMLGISYQTETSGLRQHLLKSGVITGSSAKPEVMRLLPPLSAGAPELELLITKLNQTNE